MANHESRLSGSVPKSASLSQPGYWWYRARSDLLRIALERYVPDSGWILDVGSADSPSVGWLQRGGRTISLDVDYASLPPGGVCGSLERLPFADGVFGAVCAFDVVEHCQHERVALEEIVRVLSPGGRLLLSVPAYQWAWTDFDVRSGHYRRYTRARISAAVSRSGLQVDRVTHAFAATFPIFALQRLAGKVSRRKRESSALALPEVSPGSEAVLMALCRIDQRLLGDLDLPFGSSIVVAATKPLAQR